MSQSKRPAKGGDFKNLWGRTTAFMEEDMDQAETAADNARVAEQSFDLFGTGIGDDIKVDRCMSQKHISYSTAGKVGGEIIVFESVEDLYRIVRDFFTGDRMG